jgi:hypothetical protein
MQRCVASKTESKKEALRRGLKEFDRVTVFCCHQRGKHFNLKRRNVGKKANDILHATLVRAQHVEDVTDQVESAGFDAVATEDTGAAIGTTRFWVMGVKARANDWDPIRGLHQGQRSWCRANRPDT